MTGSTESREKAVPKYFLKTPPAPELMNLRRWLIAGAVLIGLGLLAALFDISCLVWGGIIGGLAVIGVGLVARSGEKTQIKTYQALLAERYEPKPSDQQMDEWLHGDIKHIKADALRKLDLLPKRSVDNALATSQESSSTDRAPLPVFQDSQEGNPGSSVGDLIIVDPNAILQRPSGKTDVVTGEGAGSSQPPRNVLKYLVVKGPERDADLAVGQDGIVRYSKYRILVMYLTDYHMASYQCSLDMAKGADTITSESTQEYHYADVVSVATQTDSSEFSVMVNGKKTVLPSYQKFAMAVSSGDRTEMAVSFPQLKDQLKDIILTNIKPTTEIDDAISVIRARLREKKGGLKI